VIALHGGGEYGPGDERAMDALVFAAVEAAGGASGGSTARIVVVPTAAARQRPELAASHGVAAFRDAARRRGADADVQVAWVLDPLGADDETVIATLDAAHLVHFPGGDPDLIPALLRGTRAWDAVLRAYAAGACIAGASAGAMALGERLWTRDGGADGLALVPRVAVLPHFGPGRLASWRRDVEAGRSLAWVGIDERTVVVGHPGGRWRVAGAGRAHVIPPGADRPSASAGDGETLSIP